MQHQMNKGYYLTKCVLMGLFGLLFFGFITMLLWNWLVPVLFNGPVLNYFQSLGLLALSKLLTVGFWARPFNRSHANHSFWKRRLQEKISTLAPEEREAFKQKLKDKWCRWDKESEAKGTSND
jgi:hypothetical protein